MNFATLVYTVLLVAILPFCGWCNLERPPSVPKYVVGWEVNAFKGHLWYLRCRNGSSSRFSARKYQLKKIRHTTSLKSPQSYAWRWNAYSKEPLWKGFWKVKVSWHYHREYNPLWSSLCIMRIWVSYIEHLANHGCLGKPVEALPNWYAYQGSHAKISALNVIILQWMCWARGDMELWLLFTCAIRGSESRVWFTICHVAKCYTLLQICYAILKVCSNFYYYAFQCNSVSFPTNCWNLTAKLPHTFFHKNWSLSESLPKCAPRECQICTKLKGTQNVPVIIVISINRSIELLPLPCLLEILFLEVSVYLLTIP